MLAVYGSSNLPTPATLWYIDPRIIYILSGYNYRIFCNIYAPIIVNNYLGDIQHQNNLQVFIKSRRNLTYISPYINQDITLQESNVFLGGEWTS